jgi:mannose-6-phosphate isomerase-like protein (cupin superfamily)
LSDPYPYVVHLEPKFGALETIDVAKLAAACTDRWYNQTLCRVEDSVVRLGVVEGEYHWHHHDDEDEFFYVVEGKLLVDFREGDVERTIDLSPGQGVVVPKKVEHRPRAPQRTVILMVEKGTIVPTGTR